MCLGIWKEARSGFLNEVVFLFIGSAFICAALLKVLAFHDVMLLIRQLGFFSPGVSTVVASGIAVAEFIVGGLLIYKIARKVGFLGLLTLSAIFWTYNLFRLVGIFPQECPCMPGLLHLSPHIGLLINSLTGFVGYQGLGGRSIIATTRI